MKKYKYEGSLKKKIYELGYYLTYSGGTWYAVNGNNIYFTWRTNSLTNLYSTLYGFRYNVYN